MLFVALKIVSFSPLALFEFLAVLVDIFLFLRCILCVIAKSSFCSSHNLYSSKKTSLQ